MNIGKGDFSKGLAFSLGLPSQLVSLTLNKLGVTETKNPVLGVNDWLTIFHSMGMSGSIPSNERGFYEKIFGRTLEEVGAAAFLRKHLLTLLATQDKEQSQSSEKFFRKGKDFSQKLLIYRI